MAKTTGLASISAGSSEIHKIDPRKLVIREGWNSRDFSDPENAQWVEDLCSSIMSLPGVKEPITVTYEKGIAYVDDGECRVRAALLAIKRGLDLKTVPVKAEDRYANEVDRLVNQRVRNSGKPFTVFEDAKHYKRMLDLGLNQDEIAKKCCISAARVSQVLEYNKVGPGVKAMVMNGEVSPSLAMATVKEAGTAAEQQLKQAMEVAKAAGATKIKPAHIAEAGGAPKVNVKNAVKEAFEYADIDDSDDAVVVVKFPADKFEVIKDILKL